MSKLSFITSADAQQLAGFIFELSVCADIVSDRREFFGAVFDAALASARHQYGYEPGGKDSEKRALFEAEYQRLFVQMRVFDRHFLESLRLEGMAKLIEAYAAGRPIMRGEPLAEPKDCAVLSEGYIRHFARGDEILIISTPENSISGGILGYRTVYPLLCDLSFQEIARTADRYKIQQPFTHVPVRRQRKMTALRLGMAL